MPSLLGREDIRYRSQQSRSSRCCLISKLSNFLIDHLDIKQCSDGSFKSRRIGITWAYSRGGPNSYTYISEDLKCMLIYMHVYIYVRTYTLHIAIRIYNKLDLHILTITHN